MLRVEPGECVSYEPCPCCARPRRASFGFVHRLEDTVAFYFALLEPEHAARGRSAFITLSVGEWANETKIESRRAIVIRARHANDDVEVSVADPSLSPYRDSALLGTLLTPAEALGGVLRDQFLEIAEAIVLEDPEVNEHLMR